MRGRPRYLAFLAPVQVTGRDVRAYRRIYLGMKPLSTPALTLPACLEYVHRWHHGTPADRREVERRLMGSVWKRVRRTAYETSEKYRTLSVTREELESAGLDGALKALACYLEPGRTHTATFSTFAKAWIAAACVNEVQTAYKQPTPFDTTTAEAGITLYNPQTPSDQDSIYASASLLRALAEKAGLTDYEYDLLILRADGADWREIVSRTGRPYATVRGHHRRALARLREVAS